MPCSVDWSKVQCWSEIDSPEEAVYLCSVDEAMQDVVDAKHKELNNLISNDVFEEVSDAGKPVITTKWVITEKFKDEKKVVKARLVARGFEEDSTELRTDSPTRSKRNLRLVLAVAASKGWTINSLDISSAFLQSDARKVFVFLWFE